MQKFIAFMEKYLVPIAGRIGSQRHLVAIVMDLSQLCLLF